MAISKAQVTVVWNCIQHGAHRLADFQARLILSLLYGLFIVPVGFFVRAHDDPLQLHKPTPHAGY